MVHDVFMAKLPKFRRRLEMTSAYLPPRNRKESLLANYFCWGDHIWGAGSIPMIKMAQGQTSPPLSVILFTACLISTPTMEPTGAKL